MICQQPLVPSVGCRTLLWIGPRQSSELLAAFKDTESLAGQVAYRRSLADAYARPATSVDRIVFTRTTRAPFDWMAAAKMAIELNCEKAICVLGSLCHGVRHTERFAIVKAAECLRISERLCGIETIDWHQCRLVLPSWITAENGLTSEIAAMKPTVAVIASCLAIAEPLMELATQVGAAAIWLRHPESHRLRNVDIVLWDDSAAEPASKARWQQRLAMMHLAKHAKHAWIANNPQSQQLGVAYSAGIELVLGKPYQIESLTQWMASTAASDQPSADTQSPHTLSAAAVDSGGRITKQAA